MREFDLSCEKSTDVSCLQEKLRQIRVGLVAEVEKNVAVFGCYMVFDREGVIQYLNLEGLNTLDMDSLRRQGWRLDFPFPEDAVVFSKCLDQALAGGGSEHCEVRLRTGGGLIKWARIELKSGRDGEHCHAVLTDITDRRREEDALAANEMKYRALFAKMSTAFSYHRIICGSRGNVCEPILLDANDAFGLMTGIPVHEIIGKNSSEISLTGHAPALDWQRLCQDVAIARQPACFEYYDKNLRRWLSVIAYSPAPEHMALVYVDISKTKVTEADSAADELQYHSLIQGADVIMMILNERAEVTFINDYGLSFFGFDSSELLSRSIFETIAPSFDLADRNLQQAIEKFKGNPAGGQHRNIQENLTRSGRRVWVDWTNHALQDPKTGEQMVICVGVDVTDSKRSEQDALRRHKQQRQTDFLNDAIHRRMGVTEWMNAAQLMGIELQPPLVLSLLEIPGSYLSPGASEHDRIERQYAMDSLIETLQYVGAGVTWQAPDGIAILRSVPDKRSGKIVQQAQVIASDIVATVSRYWHGIPLRVGISRFSVQTQNLGEMYAQAQAAITYGPLLHPDQQVHYWHELGCFQFVLNDLGSERAQRFVRDSLGPLMRDCAGGESSDLLQTLQELLSGESAQVIAKKLHIHPQTVAFRKKKIEKSLNADLDAMEVRLKLTIAIRMLSFTEKNSRMAHLVV